MSEVWLTELQNHKFLLFYAAKYVAFFFFLTAQTENEYSVLICEMGANNTALEKKFKIWLSSYPKTNILRVRLEA